MAPPGASALKLQHMIGLSKIMVTRITVTSSNYEIVSAVETNGECTELIVKFKVPDGYRSGDTFVIQHNGTAFDFKTPNSTQIQAGNNITIKYNVSEKSTGTRLPSAERPIPHMHITSQMNVTVPSGANEGDVIDFKGEDQQIYNVTVPQGFSEGDIFRVDMPIMEVGDHHQEAQMETGETTVATVEGAGVGAEGNAPDSIADHDLHGTGIKEKGSTPIEAPKIPFQDVIDSIEACYETWDSIEWLGSGSYGFVCRSRMPIGPNEEMIKVGIKFFKEYDREFEFKDVLYNIRNESIIKIYGYAIEEPGGSGYEVDYKRNIHRFTHALLYETGEEPGYAHNLDPDELKFKFSHIKSITTVNWIDTVTEFASDIVNGLDALHQNDIIHRDLKPLNLLCIKHKSTFGLANQVKIIDFGLSIFQSKNPAYVSGSFGYTDEVARIRGHVASTKDDIFSLGLTLFSILTRTQNSYKMRCEDLRAGEIYQSRITGEFHMHNKDDPICDPNDSVWVSNMTGWTDSQDGDIDANYYSQINKYIQNTFQSQFISIKVDEEKQKVETLQTIILRCTEGDKSKRPTAKDILKLLHPDPAAE
jgi:serine/threonine protein kinase